MDTVTFFARTIRGSGRGRDMGVPTINVDLSDVPQELQEGIYACWMTVDGKRCAGAMHYGPRPVHGDSPSCEVHLLDAKSVSMPQEVEICVVGFIRSVENFASESALLERIQKDIDEARAILNG